MFALSGHVVSVSMKIPQCPHRALLGNVKLQIYIYIEVNNLLLDVDPHTCYVFVIKVNLLFVLFQSDAVHVGMSIPVGTWAGV